MIVNEIFYSIQGEGFLAGVPTVFIRLAGCPLRCRWCDTKYAWSSDAGSELSINSIVESINKYPCSHIVITGGEPMIAEQLPILAAKLKAAGKHITIETSGIAFTANLACDLMSISPKLSNSLPDDLSSQTTTDSAIIRQLIDNYNYQLKFVIDSPEDIPEIERIIKNIGNIDRTKVMLMPQARTRPELLEKLPVVAEICKNTGLALSQRLHILLWDDLRGK